MKTSQRNQGFALVLVLSLLALALLIALALATLSRTANDVGRSGQQGREARQNALAALGIAIGDLQRLAGQDDRVTAMAGITGISANANSQTRHWCGVWSGGGDFLGWLASGAQSSTPAVQPGLRTILLVANGSTGSAQANSEPVVAGVVPFATGNFAYWVGDEGVKLSAKFRATELAVPGVAPLLSDLPTNSNLLRAALAANPTRLSGVVSFEQLRYLPPSALTAGVLHDNFHHVTLSAIRLLPGPAGVVPRSGTFNLNTTSAIAWRGLFQTYNASGASPQIASASLGTTASAVTTQTGPVQMRIVRNFSAESAAGKIAGGPFLSVDAFGASPLLSSALTASASGVTPAQFMVVMRDMLTVRSDTFRIRAYGESVNPADPQKIEAVAYCEAIVQRVDEPAGTLGRRFVITYFRWLTPADI